ncbi:glycerophosphoryl diester phosphodiesterase [Diplodia corticola]|uniref:Glycerophosphoryl diester phosphodiesterase n=1 Tax=Diplodia corticola TaxID=236234 RepID=A0A1J9QWT5_9PEZI|nr:glycerophosphoryl diester phosphodiesterase [Diplodia corticola]OJD32880.1 glycerophosphoryl diester phosphodiesterase [Diplodia corticola]
MAASSLTQLARALGIAALVANAAAYPIPVGDLKGHIEVQAHRGGIGMRNEESLWAFAYALEIGADTLEMDTVFTKDGVPVIWHDHYIYPTKCTGDYVGDFINNLTLAQVKSLDCHLQLEEHLQQETHPGTKIATLEEVLDLVNCYGDDKVTINLETKLDPTTPEQTWPVDKYLDLMPILQKHRLLERTTIQSFDWRTLVQIHDRYPSVATVALLDDTTVVPDANGTYPWLGGLDLADYAGDWVAAAAAIGSSVLSPVHGFPSNLTVNSPGYTPFTTKDVVDEAHALGMKVIPWTADHEVTISKLLDDGVDAVISNYPERVMAVARQRGLSVGRPRNPSKPECLAKASG